jgi:hypothetical protein
VVMDTPAGQPTSRGSHADPQLCGKARGRDGGIREVMATRVKRVTVVAGRAVHVDHRARNPAAPVVKREAEEDWGRVKWG